MSGRKFYHPEHGVTTWNDHPEIEFEDDTVVAEDGSIWLLGQIKIGEEVETLWKDEEFTNLYIYGSDKERVGYIVENGVFVS
jgi:hypothetical protein